MFFIMIWTKLLLQNQQLVIPTEILWKGVIACLILIFTLHKNEEILNGKLHFLCSVGWLEWWELNKVSISNIQRKNLTSTLTSEKNVRTINFLKSGFWVYPYAKIITRRCVRRYVPQECTILHCSTGYRRWYRFFRTRDRWIEWNIFQVWTVWMMQKIHP